MPTIIEIRDAVDVRLANLLPAIQTFQTNYAASHDGKFFQGLRTHTITPSEGETRTPDIGTRTPTDQPATPWPAVIRNHAGLEMSLQLDCYDGPLGRGWVGIVQVSVAGRTWERARNEGPETWRTVSWRRLGPDE